MLAFLFLQGFKGEPGEDGLVVSIAQKHPRVRAPRPPFTSHHPSARCSTWFCVVAYGGQKNPMGNYRCPKMDVCPGVPVPWGEKRPVFVPLAPLQGCAASLSPLLPL